MAKAKNVAMFVCKDEAEATKARAFLETGGHVIVVFEPADDTNYDSLKHAGGDTREATMDNWVVVGRR